MQLAPLRILDPAVARNIVTHAATEIDRLDAKLHREFKLNYHVSREWPGEVAQAASLLRSAGNALRSLGPAHASAGADLLATVPGVVAFGTELATAYAQHAVFGPRNADWLTRLRDASNAAAAALGTL